jgi:16S rRNA (adenine1518-N6/adenine1519-N6)-dimethyltransferase
VVTDRSGESPAETLHRHGLAPRRRLGQNFLRDRSFLARILDAAEVGPQDQVVEIGAGTGVLTRALLERAGRVLSLELDDRLYALLEQELGNNPRWQGRHGNALDFEPARHVTGPYKLVGNIPYYITGPILRHFLEASHTPSLMVLMVQREVAERMTAPPGRLSLLGVSVQYYAEVTTVTRVPAEAFYPAPRVDSAIVKLVPFSGARPVHPDDFFAVARAGFAMRRKQIGNSLAAGLSTTREQADELLREAGIDPKRRAETLSIEEWLRLARALARPRDR